MRWTKNGKQVTQGKYVKLAQELQGGATRCSVKFDQVYPEDEGEYVFSVVRGGVVVTSSKGGLQVKPGKLREFFLFFIACLFACA